MIQLLCYFQSGNGIMCKFYGRFMCKSVLQWIDCFALNETVAGTNKFGKLGILRQSTAFSEKKRRQIKLHFQNRGYAWKRKRRKRSESFPFSAR